MSWRRKWHNGNVPKDRKKGKSIVIVQTIRWIGEMESGNMLFFGLLHYEKIITHEQLRTALATLSPKQRQRIYAHYVLGLSQAQIARCAGVRVSAVSKSIYSGLVRMEKCLKKFF